MNNKTKLAAEAAAVSAVIVVLTTLLVTHLLSRHIPVPTEPVQQSIQPVPRGAHKPQTFTVVVKTPWVVTRQQDGVHATPLASVNFKGHWENLGKGPHTEDTTIRMLGCTEEDIAKIDPKCKILSKTP